jgi:hypothetical protein
VTKRCTLVIPDAGPFNSLWVADELPLLLKLDMKIVVVDAVYDELTSDTTNYPKDREVKAFIDRHRPPFVIEPTETGQSERKKRAEGRPLRRHAGEVAIADFMAEGLEKYLTPQDPVLVLYEDSDVRTVRFIRKPSNLHLLSTVGFLRGLERVGIVSSADAIIIKMTHPTDPLRRARILNDLPHGVDEPAVIGSTWTP